MRNRIALLVPRVSVLTTGPQGGSSIVLLEDKRFLEEAGWEVAVFGPTANENIPVEELRLNPLVSRLSSFQYCGGFARKARGAMLLAYNEPTVALIAPDRSIVRFDWHTPLPRYWRIPWAKRRFARASYLFPSQASKEAWCQEHPGVAAGGINVIPNSVDTDVFHPVRPSGNGRRVGFAGQWISDKGLPVLLKAWELVWSRVPDAELWLAGGPDLWQRTHPIPQDRAVGPDTLDGLKAKGLRVLGVLPRSQMPAFWSEVDVACVPSTWEEPFGLVALEAMACGVPVVLTDAGALPEVGGDAAVVVQRGDPKALAEALVQLLHSPKERARLGERARQRATMFTLQKRRADLLGLITQVANAINR